MHEPSFSQCMSVMLALGLQLAGQAADAATAGKNAGEKSYNVREFGAVGDGKTLDTTAVQKALDACGQAGGGTVRISPGTYLIQPIFLRSGTTLQVDADATLQGTDEPDDYVDPEKKAQLESSS